jgi:hypothetical protein
MCYIVWAKLHVLHCLGETSCATLSGRNFMCYIVWAKLHVLHRLGETSCATSSGRNFMCYIVWAKLHVLHRVRFVDGKWDERPRECPSESLGLLGSY